MCTTYDSKKKDQALTRGHEKTDFKQLYQEQKNSKTILPDKD